MKPGILVLAALGTLCLPVSSAKAEVGADAVDFTPIGIKQDGPVAYPLAQEVLNYPFARVTLLIAVDSKGKLTDLLPVFYTDPLFAETALYAVHKWTFEPARLGGRPVNATKEITFNFERRGPVVVSQNVGQFADLQFRRAFPDSTTYRAYTLSQLDGKLSPVRQANPHYTQALVARGARGTVTLAYYVDEKGRVRMPVTVNDPDPELADLAVDAVRQWQFEPPIRNGRPVLVRVCQSIRFGSPVGS
jgi:TonB family protein